MYVHLTRARTRELVVEMLINDQCISVDRQFERFVNITMVMINIYNILLMLYSVN